MMTKGMQNSSTAPGMLPHRLGTFPSPYPGESFYSVLCRYHVRSGNLNSWHTRMELFGYHASVRSTLLSAYHLENISDWVPASSGITVKTMLMKHTAFPMYSFAADFWALRDIEDLLSGRKQPCRRLCNIQRSLVHPAGFLRYCPECARRQKQLYGEPYWQVLPQLDGAEFCPVHKKRFLCSTIRLADIQWDFHPASAILKDIRDNGTASGNAAYPHEIEKYLITLSENIAWILENGLFPGGYRRLADIYRDIFGCSDKYYYPHISHGAVLKALSCYHDEIRGMITTRIFRHSVDFTDGSYIYDLDPCAHVMLMMAVSGSARAFYQSAGN